ncbi:hypothetical protein B1987_08920 [Mycobacterium kansasii]|nr:hypothetical protein B1987_08920 [Mycobacterium kansasii]
MVVGVVTRCGLVMAGSVVWVGLGQWVWQVMPVLRVARMRPVAWGVPAGRVVVGVTPAPAGAAATAAGCGVMGAMVVLVVWVVLAALAGLVVPGGTPLRGSTAATAGIAGPVVAAATGG